MTQMSERVRVGVYGATITIISIPLTDSTSAIGKKGYKGIVEFCRFLQLSLFTKTYLSVRDISKHDTMGIPNNLCEETFRVSGFYCTSRENYDQEGRLRLNNGSKMKYVRSGIPLELGRQYEIIKYSMIDSENSVIKLRKVRETNE